MTLQERLRQEAELHWHGQRACVPALLHEAAGRLDTLDAELESSPKWAMEDRVQIIQLDNKLASAITCLREIAAMGKKAGSEHATHWLQQHGYALEEGGYVPGQGFTSPETAFLGKQEGVER